MRIITGSLKGRSLSVPAGTEVRPTTGKVKESLFSVIESRRYIQQSTVLDLFGGSGNLGFEAISRGAKQATFVDTNARCLKQIEKMADDFDISDKVRTIRRDALDFLAGPPIPYDIIMADPPYKYDNVEEIPQLIFNQNWLNQEGWLALEHSKYHHFTEHSHFFQEKDYGRTFTSFFISNRRPQPQKHLKPLWKH